MRSPVIVLGAGGHAKVAVELLRASGEQVAGLLDADPTPREVVGAPVLGDDLKLAELRAQGIGRAFVALGGNGLRATVARKVREAGFQLVNAVSPGAFVSPSVRLGEGVAIMAGAVINADGEIGDLAIINTGAVVDHDARIGLAAHVAPGCVLAGNVTLGARVFLGVGVSVIPGVCIGDDAVVAAGACVVRDLPPESLSLGVPARLRSPA